MAESLLMGSRWLARASASRRQSGGRESSGMTDAEGNYELKYIRDVMGAKIGEPHGLHQHRT